jgi:hypothetical protein
MDTYVAEDVSTAAAVPYTLYRPQAGPLIADDCANTYAELATSLKPYPTWVRGVVADPDESKNGLYVCVAADAELGESIWQRLLTLELLQAWAPTLGLGSGGGGSRFLLGEGAPANNLGAAGDLYLNTSVWDLFQKSNTSWVSQGSIKGADGQPGADGVSPQLLHGDGDPAPTLAAAVGTWFLNSTSGELFAFEARRGWTSLAVLKGKPGEPGQPGTGNKWYLVQDLPGEALGTAGDLALNTLTSEVYVRGVLNWSETEISLRGLPGKPGEPGPGGTGSRIYAGAGAPGAGLGVLTDFYIQYNGLLYEKTAVGTWSSRGQLQFAGAGAAGPGGPSTPTSTSRVLFYYGTEHPDLNAALPPVLPDGTVYVDQTAGDLYSLVSGTWTFVLQLKGEDGKPGNQGVPGQSIAGAPGKDGTDGKDGEDGADGANGETYTDISSSGWDYYLKQNNAWVKLGALKGLKGDPGSRIHYFGSDPGSTDGNISDTGINSITGDLFEKTSATTWTKRGNMKGPRGEDGADGTGSAGGTGENTGTAYTLPRATVDTLGGIKLGANLTYNAATGRVDATASTSSTGVSLPAQAGNAGKVLGTDGTALSWTTPTASGGGVKTVNGVAPNDEGDVVVLAEAPDSDKYFDGSFMAKADGEQTITIVGAKRFFNVSVGLATGDAPGGLALVRGVHYTESGGKLTILANAKVLKDETVQFSYFVGSVAAGQLYQAGVNISITAGNVINTQIATPPGTVISFLADAEYSPIFSGTFTVDTTTLKVGTVAFVELGPAATVPVLDPLLFELEAGRHISGRRHSYGFRVTVANKIRYVITQLP